MVSRKIAGEFKALLFTLPAMIPLALFWLIPLGWVAYLSLVEWDFMSPDMPFVGLDNFKLLLSDPSFHQALTVTVLFCLGSVVPNLIIGLLLAVLLNEKMKGGAIYRLMMFAPWVTPTVAVSIVWSWIYEPEVGLANTVLRGIGLEGIRWLQDPKWALVGVLLVTIWKSVGWCMVFFLVALRNVPKELQEAANLDGATGWQAFKSVTLPLISPTTFFLAVVQLITAMQAYDQINILTQGGPAGSTRTLLYLYYQSAFTSFRIGEASAVAVILIASCAAMSVCSFIVARRTVHYN
ncbi:carbohydrate ABC transporter permease [Paenibacillus sp. CAU 1782]